MTDDDIVPFVVEVFRSGGRVHAFVISGHTLKFVHAFV